MGHFSALPAPVLKYELVRPLKTLSFFVDFSVMARSALFFETLNSIYSIYGGQSEFVLSRIAASMISLIDVVASCSSSVMHTFRVFSSISTFVFVIATVTACRSNFPSFDGRSCKLFERLFVSVLTTCVIPEIFSSVFYIVRSACDLKYDLRDK